MKILTMGRGLVVFDLPHETDWSSAQTDLGMVFPRSFKEIVNRFGTGLFGNLTLFNPASKLPHMELRNGVRSCVSERQILVRELSVELYPAKGGYVRIGRGTDRWDILCRPGSAKCDDWIWADWELSQVIPMKAELGDWLVRAYLRQHSDPISRELSLSVWHGDDQPEEPFFHPVKSPEAHE